MRLSRALARAAIARRFSATPAAAAAAAAASPSAAPLALLDLEFARLQAVLASMGLPRYRAEQVWRAALRGEPAARSFAELRALPAAARAALAAAFAPLRPEGALGGVAAEDVSADGTVKWLMRVGSREAATDAAAAAELSALPQKPVERAGGGAAPSPLSVEAVFIPEARRGSGTLCVSSQAGCSLACSFCRTGTQPLSGSLRPAAILEQFLVARERVRALGAPVQRISHVVFMGQGEPLLNWRSVRTAIRALTHPLGGGLAPRRVTVSTAGVAPLIARVASDTPGVRLAVSLHAPRDALRGEIMGVNAQWGVADVLRGAQAFIDARLDALRRGGGVEEGDGDGDGEGEDEGDEAAVGESAAATAHAHAPAAPRSFSSDRHNGARRVRVTFEYVLLDGVNDDLGCARELAALLHASIRDAPANAHVNLIHFSPWPGAPFRRSSDETAAAFQHALARRGLRATVRRSRGLDVLGACGMLKSSDAVKRPAVAAF